MKLSAFPRKVSLASAIIILLFSVFGLYAYSEHQIDLANNQRIISYQVSDELRQNSADLTMMVRAYIATSNPLYKKYYQQILDIRNGNIPRPERYVGVYWDLVLAKKIPPPIESGQGVALMEKMRLVGFTDQELAKLAEAKKLSDDLTWVEFKAMRLIESENPVPDTIRATALQLLNDEYYLNAKAGIMQPISDFFELMDKRTLNNVQQWERVASVIRLLFIAAALGSVFLLWQAFVALRRTLGASADEIHAQLQRIGQGDLTQTINVANGFEISVFASICKMQQQLRVQENALKESEFRWKFAIEGSGDGLWDWNVQTNKVFFSHQWKAMLGYADYEIGDTLDEWKKRVHPEDITKCMEDVERHFLGETLAYINEHRILCKDGSYKWILDRAMVVERSKDNKPLRVIGTHTDITTRRNVEESLKLADERLNLAVEFGDIGVWDLDLVNDKAWRNLKHDQVFGYDTLQPQWGQEICARHVVPEDRHIFLQAFTDAASTGKLYVECRIIQQDQSIHWISVRGRTIYDNHRQPIRMLGIVADITERRKVEDKLRIAAITFETQEGILVTDATNHILSVNHAFTKITGYSLEDVVGKQPQLLSSGTHDKSFHVAMWNSIIHKGTWSGEVMNRRKNGDVYPSRLVISAVKDKDGQICNYVGSIADISEARAASEKINNLVFYDPLTQLPNRRLFFDRLQRAMSYSARSNQKAALLFLDIDHFKNLNDTLGHLSGDILLQQVADRLVNAVREGDTVARIGGDEFVLLLEGLSEKVAEAITQIELIISKLHNCLSEIYQIGMHNHNITVSIGATLINNHDKSTEEILKQADIAMYQAKEGGRNTWRFFDPVMQETINQRVRVEKELWTAIEQKQFRLHYQIQVDNNGLPIGAESLIRWQHPERGLTSPFYFIQLAEESGLILQIGQWVLETACAQLALWRRRKSTRELSISVNVSAKQFHQPDFVESVRDTLSRYDIDPAYLKLEITESALLEDIELMIINMIELKKIGIRFELDDFGTGYSSLQYLKVLPLNQLKIDQSFVREIVTNDSDKTLVRTIISMAHHFDLKVIAEGVENEDQLQFLKKNGCDHYQGYLFSRPVPIEEFEPLLNSLQSIHH